MHAFTVRYRATLTLLLTGVLVSTALILLVPPAVTQQTAPELTAVEEDEGVRLHWTRPEGQGRWAVLKSYDEFGLNEDTLAYTSDTTYFDPEGLDYQGGRVFYRVVPWIPDPPPNNTQMIEGFDQPVMLIPFGDGFDNDPVWTQMLGSSNDPEGMHLDLAGDTWKTMMLDDPIQLDFETIWSVDAMSDTTSRLQMIGLGDGTDEMWYVLWGQYAPNTDSLIWTYQGWYPEFEWQTFHLPVGEDWHGRFGNNPQIDRLFFVNDYENPWLEWGHLKVDRILDATEAMPLPPTVQMNYEIIEQNPQELVIDFDNWSYDNDSPYLESMWSFGDGTFSVEDNPVHTYPRFGEWPVTLRITDGWDYWDYQTVWITDPPVIRPRGQFTINCAGDVILARGIADHIDNLGPDAIFAGVVDVLNEADLTMVNLESPMTTSNDGHPTKGILFKADPEDTHIIPDAGIDFVTIANNHILDYMESGMVETHAHLDDEHVAWGGAGMTDVIARRPTFLNINRMTFGIVSMSNRDGHYNNYQPFLDAARDRPGFALWNRTGIEATIPALQDSCDLVMAQVHCGSEYSFIPMDGDNIEPGYTAFEIGPDDPNVIFELVPDSGEVALRHYAIEQGADLVICHHPHIIQGLEVYQGKFIAHSLGNFVFDLSYNATMPTMILNIQIGDEPNEIAGASIKPAYIENDLPVMATGELGRGILDYITHYSKLLDTQVIRPPDELIAHVQFDTNYTTNSTQGVRIIPVAEHNDTTWRTSPQFLNWEGYVTQLRVPNAPPGTQIRYGRDILLWANMEDEGTDPWNINSNYESYNTQQAYEGQRSLRIQVPPGTPYNYVTNFNRRVKLQTENQHSFSGWIKTNTVNESNYEIRYYQNRDNDAPLLYEATTPSLTGTQDWTQVHYDFDEITSNWNFIDVRCNQEPSGPQQATAWYDEVAYIEWQPWQDVDGNGTVVVPYPNAYRYAQVQIPSDNVPPGEQITFYYQRKWPSFYNAPADVEGGEAARASR